MDEELKVILLDIRNGLAVNQGVTHLVFRLKESFAPRLWPLRSTVAFIMMTDPADA